jgi:hypothetical protein
MICLPKDLQAPPQRAKIGAVLNNILRGNVMKRMLILLLLIGIAGCGSDAETENTPAGLLKKIYALAQKEDYEKLQECIFPHSVQRLPDMMLQGIKEQKSTGGDGVYSHKALKILIDNHLDKLKPGAALALEYCVSEGNGGFGKDKRVAEIAKTQPQDITMFDFGRVHILIIKFEGEHRLLFWENLTRLSGEYRREEDPEPVGGDEEGDTNKSQEAVPATTTDSSPAPPENE